MTFKSKDRTENTPLLSSAGSTEGPAQPSAQSARTDNTPDPMQITNLPSMPTLPVGPLDEKTVLSALMLKASLQRLEKNGLIRRYKVLSRDEQGQVLKDNHGVPVVREYRLVFDPEIWGEDLKLLSEAIA